MKILIIRNSEHAPEGAFGEWLAQQGHTLVVTSGAALDAHRAETDPHPDLIDDLPAVTAVAEADLVLVGVSRSSKTPTCFYLANRGVKAANVPIVPGAELPRELDEATCPIIGLTIDVHALIDIRRHRLKLIGADGIRQDSLDYIDPDAVQAEILAARRLCSARGWPVVDVTRRSIEETAATILQIVDRWHLRKKGHA